MFDFKTMTPEELFKFGSWLYYICEGWNDPDWWEKNRDLAEKTGHVITIHFTR